LRLGCTFALMKITAAITGVGGYVPDYVLTNEELEKLVDTTDEWIVTRTGIKERRILKGKDQGSSVMGIKAARGGRLAYLRHRHARRAVSGHG
jgi:hypothetical protein